MQLFDFNGDWQFRKIGPETVSDPVSVTLPHDAMLQDKRDEKSPGGGAGAFFVPGIYEYTKTFLVPKDWNQKHARLRFGGIYKNAKIYLNDTLLAEQAYGYTPFSVDLDPALRYGEGNTFKVVVDNSKLPNTRWYSGAGIYRSVQLMLGGKAYIKDVKIKTVTYKPAKIYIATEYQAMEDAHIRIEILAEGRRVAGGEGDKCTLKVPKVRNWTAEHPYLYTAKVYLEVNGQVVDETETTFGIRGLEWSSAGLKVNGREVLLKGACIHHDNGILGACSYKEAEERRIRILKEQGFNAIRSAHNPASDELLAAADKLGMYVMDETFDQWYIRKNAYDYAVDFERDWKKDVRCMVERDFNHPSVIMYSIGNELSEPAKKKGQEVAAEMRDFIRDIDSSRPVTAGMNVDILAFAGLGLNTYSDNGVMTGSDKETNPLVDKLFKGLTGSLLFNTIYQKVGFAMNAASMLPFVDKGITPFCNILDIAGYNYGSWRYTIDAKKYPARILVGSETLPPDIYKNWQKVKKYPQLIGDFMWAGWDYMGEAGVGTWNYEGANMMNVTMPWLLAGSGVVDINGNPDGSAKYASTVWGNELLPVLAVQPVNHPGAHIAKSAWRGTNARLTWSWQGCTGNDAVVEVYTAGAFAELHLNGTLVGIKRTKEQKAIFHIKYEPGVLECIAYDKYMHEIGRNSLTSADPNTTLCILPEKTEAEPNTLVYVPLQIQDANGILEANADQTLSLTVDNGTLMGLGSASPKNAEPYTGTTCTTYYGQALAVIRVGASGTTTITATTQNGVVEACIEVL